MAKMLHRGSAPIGRQVARLLKELGYLRIDMAFLLSGGIPRDFVPPPRRHYADDGSHYRATRELRHLHQFEVVRDEVARHEIRDGLERRLCSLWLSGGPITLLFCIGIAFLWLRCLFANPQTATWFQPSFWAHAISHGGP
jgi:hypothetical protein